jgi:hypothetical protein
MLWLNHLKINGDKLFWHHENVLFEGLEYHQGARIRYERVKDNNSCDRTLIFGSFSFIDFLSVFFFLFAPFCFLCL